MKTLAFEGHSDDTFGEYGVFHDDYDCCASGVPIVFELVEDGINDAGNLERFDSLLVVGQYGGTDWGGRPGCWAIGLQQTEEDNPIPPWPMRWATADNGYSPRLEIDVPDSVTMTCWNRQSKERMR